MALSSISTHKLACILAPIDIPKTAESKQSQIAASEVLLFVYKKNGLHTNCTQNTLCTQF